MGPIRKPKQVSWAPAVTGSKPGNGTVTTQSGIDVLGHCTLDGFWIINGGDVDDLHEGTEIIDVPVLTFFDPQVAGYAS